MKIERIKHPIYKAVALLRLTNLTDEKVEKDTEELLNEIERFQESITESQKELTLVDLLSEDTIMSGKVDPSILDIAEKLRVTGYDRKALIELGLTPEEVGSIRSTNMQIKKLATVIGEVGFKIYDGMLDAVTKDEWDSPYIEMYREGIKLTATDLLSYKRYAMLSLTEELGLTTQMSKEDILTKIESVREDYSERYEEWVNKNIDNAIEELCVSKYGIAYVSPIKVEECVNELEKIDVKLYNIATNYGENIGSLAFKNDEKFINAVRNLEDDNTRKKVLEVLNVLTKLNSIPMDENTLIPNAISIIDPIVAIMLIVGDKILDGEEITEDHHKVVLDLYHDVLRDCNSVDVANNVATLLSRYINKAMMTSVMLRIRGSQEIVEVTGNLTKYIEVKNNVDFGEEKGE